MSLGHLHKYCLVAPSRFRTHTHTPRPGHNCVLRPPLGGAAVINCVKMPAQKVRKSKVGVTVAVAVKKPEDDEGGKPSEESPRKPKRWQVKAKEIRPKKKTK